MLIAAAKAAPGVLADPPPDSFPVDFTDTAVVYAVRFWVQEFARQTEIEGEVRARIWYAAQRAHMEIPHPARLVQIPGELEKTPLEGGEPERAKRTAMLERLDLFSGLDPGDRDFLAGRMRKVQFAAGEPIIRQGEAGNSLFIIAEGEVVVSIGAAGMDQTITILGAGTFFGEMSLVTGEPRNASCSARSDATCYVIDHQALKPLLTQRPQLAEHLSSLLFSRQATLQRKGGELHARAAQAAEERGRLLTRIKTFFDLR
jgi:CRP-like cAMP-binding protein